MCNRPDPTRASPPPAELPPTPPHPAAAAGLPSEAQLRRAFFLTNGSGAELRRYAQQLLQDDDPLGLSRGHKAAAAARRQAQLDAFAPALAV
jgi:hypothetical protein